MGHWHPLPVNIAIENQHVFIFGAELSILMGHLYPNHPKPLYWPESTLAHPPRLSPAVLISTWPGQGLDAVHRTDHVVIVLEKGAREWITPHPHVSCEYPLVLVVLKPLQPFLLLEILHKKCCSRHPSSFAHFLRKANKSWHQVGAN